MKKLLLLFVFMAGCASVRSDKQRLTDLQTSLAFSERMDSEITAQYRAGKLSCEEAASLYQMQEVDRRLWIEISEHPEWP